MEYLKNRYDGNFLVLDSDIFITQDLSNVFYNIEKYQIISYDCGYREDVSINGISIQQMRQLVAKFNGGGTAASCGIKAVS